MEALKILDKPGPLTWDYDEEADVLYLALGNPQPALSLAIGEGLILRYDESKNEVVGLTVIGLRERLKQHLSARS